MEVHYRVHKSPPLILIMRQMHSVHSLPPYFPKTHSNIIVLCTPRSSKRSLPFRFSNQNIICISHFSHPCYMPRPSHPPRLDNPNNIWWSAQVRKLLIKQSFPISRHFLSLRSEYSPQYPVSNTLNASSLHGDQSAHPYGATCKIIESVKFRSPV